MKKNFNRQLIKCILWGGFLLKNFGDGSMLLRAAMSPVEYVSRNVATIQLFDLLWKFFDSGDLDYMELHELLQMGADVEWIKELFNHESDEIINEILKEARKVR